jgi:hypothetical protein
LLIAVDVVTAAILTVAFADYWWLAATAGLAAAIGLAVLLMRTVAIRKSQTKSPVDNKMVSSQWHRLLWASIGMALIIAVIAGLSHSLIPLLLLVLPALSVLSGLAAVSLVSRGPHQNPPN